MSDAIEVYAWGIVHCSVCAPAGMSREVVEAQVNATRPTGLDHGWAVHDEPFRDGSANPHPCEDKPDHVHWLMVC